MYQSAPSGGAVLELLAALLLITAAGFEFVKVASPGFRVVDISPERGAFRAVGSAAVILDRIHEGGPGAYLAIALGLLGVLLAGVALVSLLGKSRSSFALGVATLIVAMTAAAAGMGGTVWGRRQVTNALGYVESGVDKERIMRAGFREAQSASWIGLFAALIPLALGAAAAVGGSRIQAPKTRAQSFGDPMVSADQGLGGQTVVAFIFTAIGVIACGGAWAMAHSELPKLRYGFDDSDRESWDLAGALEDVEKDRRNGCRNLGEALDFYWGATDKSEWPRTMRKPISPELAGWRAAADKCSKKMIDAFGDDAGDENLLGQTALLESPLLQDEALRAQALAWKPEGADEPPPANVFGAGGLGAGINAALGNLKEEPAGPVDRTQIVSVIKRNMNALRFCYETELTKSPNLEGKLVVDFAITADGHVPIASEASEPAFPNKKVTSCVLSRFRKMEFPKHEGGPVKVKYPLIFKSAQ